MSTFYITKYALTKGIFAVNGEVSVLTPGMLVERMDGGRGYYHGEGRDWHRTPEGALARAEEMRAAKLKSLRKSIARIEQIKFSIEGARETDAAIQPDQRSHEPKAGA